MVDVFLKMSKKTEFAGRFDMPRVPVAGDKIIVRTEELEKARAFVVVEVCFHNGNNINRIEAEVYVKGLR